MPPSPTNASKAAPKSLSRAVPTPPKWPRAVLAPSHKSEPRPLISFSPWAAVAGSVSLVTISVMPPSIFSGVARSFFQSTDSSRLPMESIIGITLPVTNRVSGVRADLKPRAKAS